MLVYPVTLSFDWGMDAIPRLNCLCDSRNLISLMFYSVLTFAVAINLHHLYRRMKLVMAMANVHYRKPRSIKKRKAFQLPTNCNNNSNNHNSENNNSSSNDAFVNNPNDKTNHSHNLSANCNNNSGNNVINYNYSTKIADCLCTICKDGLNVRHSSSCRAINNNNVPLNQCDCPVFRHSPSPPRKRRHQQQQNTFISTPSMVQTIFSTASSHASTTNAAITIATATSAAATPTAKITTTSTTLAAHSKSLKNSPIKNLTTATKSQTNIKNTINTSVATTSVSASAASTTTNVNDTNTNHSHISHPTTTTSAVIVLSIALLTLPFLPAANLFFYVGFVVAERILYLPSVGYCLLIGLGVGKIMETNRTSLRSQRKRFFVGLCICLTVLAYSVKTINRNHDWRDEESLYRSAINVNPPKGKFFFYYCNFSKNKKNQLIVRVLFVFKWNIIINVKKEQIILAVFCCISSQI